MNTMNTIFSLELSPAELHWLAGAFSMTSLPLLDDPLRSVSISQRKQQLVRGLGSLQERGLLRGSAREGWQVDRLPAAIVRWLGSTIDMLTLDVIVRSGTSRRAQVFTEEDANMYVSLEEGSYHFLFLPDRKAVSDYLLDQLGAASLDPKPVAAKYALSQPVTILRTAWTDPGLAAKMLKLIGLKPKEIKPLLAWAESLEWIVALNRVQVEGEEAGSARKAILCGNTQGYWSGGVNGDTDDRIMLTLTDMEATRAVIQNLL